MNGKCLKESQVSTMYRWGCEQSLSSQGTASPQSVLAGAGHCEQSREGVGMRRAERKLLDPGNPQIAITEL